MKIEFETLSTNQDNLKPTTKIKIEAHGTGDVLLTVVSDGHPVTARTSYEKLNAAVQAFSYLKRQA